MQNLGGQTKSIMVFSEVAYWTINAKGFTILSSFFKMGRLVVLYMLDSINHLSQALLPTHKRYFSKLGGWILRLPPTHDRTHMVRARPIITKFYLDLVHFTGQDLLPRGKGHNRTSRCPTSPTPLSHTKDSHSTGITLGAFRGPLLIFTYFRHATGWRCSCGKVSFSI